MVGQQSGLSSNQPQPGLGGCGRGEDGPLSGVQGAELFTSVVGGMIMTPATCLTGLSSLSEMYISSSSSIESSRSSLVGSEAGGIRLSSGEAWPVRGRPSCCGMWWGESPTLVASSCWGR